MLEDVQERLHADGAALDVIETVRLKEDRYGYKFLAWHEIQFENEEFDEDGKFLLDFERFMVEALDELAEGVLVFEDEVVGFVRMVDARYGL